MATNPGLPFFNQARNDFLEATLNRLLVLAAKRASKKIRSKTLRDAMRITTQGDSGSLFIPHYWAIYSHDGRPAVTPKRKRWLVWFANPKRDDPRIANGYPERVSQVRRLTRSQWLDGLRKNRENAARGQPPFMIVVKVSGPASGSHFFEGISLEPEATEIISRLFDAFIGFVAPSETDKVTLKL